MTKNNLIRVLLTAASAVLVCAMITATFTACGSDKSKKSDKKKKDDTSSVKSEASDDTSAGDSSASGTSSATTSIDLSKIKWGNSSSTAASEETPVVFDPSDMVDGDNSTYWSPNTTDTTTVEFSLKNEATFNVVNFVEQRSYITDYILEAKQSDAWVQIYRQDEMGTRTGIIDNTVTAKDFRFTVTMSDRRGGVSEISFSLNTGYENGKNFRNSGYFAVSGTDSKNSYNKLTSLTDVILFGFGSWDKEGNFLWGSNAAGCDEAMLQRVLSQVRAATAAQPPALWFCLQNYDRKTTESTSELFATPEARDRLTQFAVDICERYGFYGIDIDYEYPETNEAWKNYSLFLKQCGDALHTKGYRLSCAMSPWGIKLSDEAIRSIDIINIMSYDLFDKRGQHSSYATAKTSITYFTEIGFKPQQLILGLPFYTRTTDQDWGPGYSGVLTRWRNAVKPWVNSTYNNKYVYCFNGIYMIRDKVLYSMDSGIAGVFNWNISGDVVQTDERSLIRTISETIQRFSK